MTTTNENEIPKQYDPAAAQAKWTLYLLGIAWILLCTANLGCAQSDETELIKAFVHLQDVPEPFAATLAELKIKYDSGELRELRQLTRELSNRHSPQDNPDPSAIPYLIALIGADNSYDTVYEVGYFLLSRMTGVKYCVFHDGAFWKRWWEKNKKNYSGEIQKIKIPELPKTEFGKTYSPYPIETETLQGQLLFCQAHAKRVKNTRWEDEIANRPALSSVAQSISEFNDPTAIPYLIAIIDLDNGRTENLGNGRDDLVYIGGYYGLGYGHPPLTDVKYDESHDGTWWKKWWEENKHQYPEAVQQIPIPSIHDEWKIPDLSREVALWRQEKEQNEKRKRDEKRQKLSVAQ
jgi:hypothetical protein